MRYVLRGRERGGETKERETGIVEEIELSTRFLRMRGYTVAMDTVKVRLAAADTGNIMARMRT